MAFRSRKKPTNKNANLFFRRNHQIRISPIRVIDSEGEMLGVMETSAALKLSLEQELDLVEISPKARPPVCKIVEYGKWIYSQQKKEQEGKKKNKQKEQKGIRLTYGMEIGDLERQKKHALVFLEKGHKVKMSMVLRGRQNAHPELGIDKMKQFIKSIEEAREIAIDQAATKTGRQISAMVAPK